MSAHRNVKAPRMTSVRAPRTRPHERRRQLLEVAESLLADGGSDALRMDALAVAAGVTRPVVYSHFDNRDALIIALLEQHEKRLRTADLPDDITEDFPTIIRTSTAAFLHTSVKHGSAMRALVSGSNLSPLVEETRRRIWDSGINRWAAVYSRFFRLEALDSLALATSHLTGLSAMAGLCATGLLSVHRATELHVISVESSLSEVTRACGTQ
jgi:AcrR family transcriptional regulator